MSCILMNQIPEDIHTEIGKYLNNRSLYNLLSSSKYNFNSQKIELKNRYQLLLDKYNREKIVKKYSKKNFSRCWYVDIFERIKTKKESEYKIMSEAVHDLYNIIKLIQAGYKEYQQDMKDMIFILMPWTYRNPKLLYFLKKMLKCGILNANVTNMSGAYPIGHAVAYNNYDAVKILVEYGNGLKSITDDQLDRIMSISKKNDNMYTYLFRQKIKRNK